MSFSEFVYEAVKKIPKGRVSTYRQIAILVGKPYAYRAIGNALNKNTDKSIPCHRVVKSNGSLGGFNRGIDCKLRMLESEGIEIGNRKIDKKYFWP